MSQSLVLKAKGLYTNPNELSEVPEGAMDIANNVIIDKEGVVESRRGFAKLEGLFAAPSDRARNLLIFQDQIIAHYDTDKLAYYDSTGDIWVDYVGSYMEPDSTFGKIRGASANQNFYFVTSAGIRKLDNILNDPTFAGGIKALDGEAALTGASGFMADNTQVAYRVLWGSKDLNDNLIPGSPSPRITIANASGGTRDVNVTFTVPAGITVDHFYQLYRSGASASSLDEANDELQLVFEGNPTAGEITAKLITVLDNTPDDLRGASLYTNPSQETILQANEPPPFAKDIAVFRNNTFFANTRTKQRLTITLTAVGGTDGIVAGDSVTFAGITYTGRVAENIASNEFQIFTGGTPAQNITNTCKSLQRVINRSATTTFLYAFYLSGFEELPGKILLEERGIGGVSFAATASAHGSAWNPTLPTSGTDISSVNDQWANGLFYSKSLQPEAVPLVNFIRVGSADKKILRILALRDALFILKEDGVYRLTGTDANSFRVDLLDNTAQLLPSESAVVLNNTIFMFIEQGACVVSDTGVEIISVPIEITFNNLLSAAFAGVKQYSFAIAHESERKYIFFTVSDEDDVVPTQAYIYNYVTKAWTRWDLSKTCGIVRSFDDKIYLGDALSNSVNVERKDRDFTDYVDDEFSINLVSYSGKELVVDDISELGVGDVISQSPIKFSTIVSINTDTNTLTVRDLVTWTAPAVLNILKAIKVEVEFLPNTGKNPGILKQYRDISCLFKSAIFSRLTLGFKSELSNHIEDVNLVGLGNGLWGLIPWGSGQWGGGAQAFPIRTYIPREKQICSQLTVKLTLQEGYSFFSLNGISIVFNNLSERLRR